MDENDIVPSQPIKTLSGIPEYQTCLNLYVGPENVFING